MDSSAIDLVTLLEALYQVEQPRAHWLRGVLRAAHGELIKGRDAGIAGVLYDVHAGLRIDAFEGVGLPEHVLAMGHAQHTDPRLTASIALGFRRYLCAHQDEYLRALVPAQSEQIKQPLDSAGVGNIVIVNGCDASGAGCALYLIGADDVQLSPLVRETLTRVATHLATAYRLQRKLAAVPDPAAPAARVEAVLRPDGAVEHAEGEARDRETRSTLAAAAVRRTRARSRRDPTLKSMAQWKGLVTGRWTLTDRVEPGGTQYVLAQRNEPLPLRLPPLSARESQVATLAALGRSNKVIAYELGVAHPTVRVLLSRAGRKLGVRTREELVAAVLRMRAAAAP